MIEKRIPANVPMKLAFNAIGFTYNRQYSCGFGVGFVPEPNKDYEIDFLGTPNLTTNCEVRINEVGSFHNLPGAIRLPKCD